MTQTDTNEDFSHIKTIHVNLMIMKKDFQDEQFQEIFEEVGSITKARFVRRKNGRPRGFGFVQFESHELALKACQMMNNKLFGDVRMGVVLAQTNIDEKKKKQEPKRKTQSPVKKEEGEAGEAKEEEPIAPSEVLFVGRLAWKCRRPQLMEIFSEFGEVKSCRVVPKGFAFVGFEDIETAGKAMEAVNGTEIMGNEVVITWAKQKQPKRRKRKNKKKKVEDGETEEVEGEKREPEASKKRRKRKSKKEKRTPEKSAQDLEEDVDGNEDPAQPKKNNKKRLYFKNLPDGLESEALEAELEKFGGVGLCKVKKWRNGNTVAFVKMKKAEDAEALVTNKVFTIGDIEATCVWAHSARRRQ